MKKFIPIIILTLILTAVSCKNKNDTTSLKTATELKTDSEETYNELANTQNRKTLTVSEYNTDNPKIKNIKRPKKTIIQNLAIDTTKVFGIWTQDPNGQHADFLLSKESFYIVDYDGNGAMPYILDRNKITVFYNDFIKKGTITSAENDTLKIKWLDIEKETKYVKFEN